MAEPTQIGLKSGDIAIRAKGALERVCSGAGLDDPSCFYSPQFLDHVNDIDLHGLAGVHKSVESYKAALSSMSIAVEDQVVDGDRVASRFVVTGVAFGRNVRINGITISRFENGLIVEDWSITDSLGLLRQLGVWRSILVGIRQWRAARNSIRSTVHQ